MEDILNNSISSNAVRVSNMKQEFNIIEIQIQTKIKYLKKNIAKLVYYLTNDIYIYYNLL